MCKGKMQRIMVISADLKAGSHIDEPISGGKALSFRLEVRITPLIARTTATGSASRIFWVISSLP